MNQVDYEWVYLLLEAKNAGISVEQIREFIEKKKPATKEIHA